MLKSSERGSCWHWLPQESFHLSASPQVRGLADRYGLQVHMDGARLMNAAVAQNMEPARITQHCDSVSLCFSKVLTGALPVFRGTGLSTQLAGWGVPGHIPAGAAVVTSWCLGRAWVPQLARCWLDARTLSLRPGACGSCWVVGCGRREF